MQKKSIVTNLINIFLPSGALQLRIQETAVDELVNLIEYLNFRSNVYYVDVEKVREELNINVPERKVIKNIINVDYRGEVLYPIYTVSKHLYKDHEKALVVNGKRNRNGFVCYESQKENDMKIVQSFHEHLQKVSHTSNTYVYGENVLGLNFYNKASLCAALEIADFIAYSTNQLIRSKYAPSELKTFDKQRLELLLDSFTHIQKYFKIQIKDVTKAAIDDYKELGEKVKKDREDRARYKKS